MAFRLIPREEKFYDDFQALADELQRGAALLEEMLAPDEPVWTKAEDIKEIEHKCDFLTHEIISRLNRTFVTPIGVSRDAGSNGVATVAVIVTCPLAVVAVAGTAASDTLVWSCEIKSATFPVALL